MLNNEIAQGSLLAPQGVMNYSMLAAWLPDVFNSAIIKSHRFDGMTKEEINRIKGDKDAFKKLMGTAVSDEEYKKAVENGWLTENQAKLSLRDRDDSSQLEHAVAYFAKNSLMSEIGIHRNPSVASGNILAENKGIEEFFIQAAKDLGITDAEGGAAALFTSPESMIQAKLQGADFDGDTVLQYAVKNNAEFGNVMRSMLLRTIKQYKEQILNNGMSAEEAAAKIALSTRKLDTKDFYDRSSPEDIVDQDMAKLMAPGGMGGA